MLGEHPAHPSTGLMRSVDDREGPGPAVTSVLGSALDGTLHDSRHQLTAGDDFLDMSRYLVLGSMMAALMQTFVPQSALLGLGSGLFRIGFPPPVVSPAGELVGIGGVFGIKPGSQSALAVLDDLAEIIHRAGMLGLLIGCGQELLRCHRGFLRRVWPGLGLSPGGASH